MLGVLHSKLIRGCNSLQGEENLAYFQNNCQEILTLGEVLTRQFRTDAHFTCYGITDFPSWPRLNKSILPEIRKDGRDIVLSYFAFDWDNPGRYVKGDNGLWTEERFSKFSNLIATHKDPIISSWSAIYITLRGARIIYTLSSPVPVDQGEEQPDTRYSTQPSQRVARSQHLRGRGASFGLLTPHRQVHAKP